jgi:hypothetical protein
MNTFTQLLSEHAESPTLLSCHEVELVLAWFAEHPNDFADALCDDQDEILRLLKSGDDAEVGVIVRRALVRAAPVQELWQRARDDYKWDMDRMPIG